MFVYIFKIDQLQQISVVYPLIMVLFAFFKQLQDSHFSFEWTQILDLGSLPPFILDLGILGNTRCSIDNGTFYGWL